MSKTMANGQRPQNKNTRRMIAQQVLYTCNWEHSFDMLYKNNNNNSSLCSRAQVLYLTKILEINLTQNESNKISFGF